jgi:hypothetical protein
MSFTDEWSTPNTQFPIASTSESPSKRASRHNRISNEIEHFSFKRRHTLANGDDDGGITFEYRVGDSVLVNDSIKMKQKFLHPPPYQMPTPTATKSRSQGKKKAVQTTEAANYEGWRHEDGLESGDKIALITRLYEDVRGTKMALVRWFARPGAVWGPEGPQDDEVGSKTLPVSSPTSLCT